MRSWQVAALGFAVVAHPALARDSDAQVRQKIIERSIATYSGNCPCPYNTDAAGRRCGARSAYSRPGGRSPKCFPEDVTTEEIAAYRARNGG